MARSAPVLQLVQITDPHLCKESTGTLLGMNTRDSLDAVLELVKHHHPNPGVVLATGDIAQDGTVEAYRCFEEKMAIFECPVFWFAGNHDDRNVMQSVIAGTQAAQRRLLSDHWQLIFLDSSVPGKVFGRLDARELQWLESALAEHPEKHALIAFHHHPVDIHCRWMKPIGLRNSDEFFDVVDRYSQVKGILWGHIHQELDSARAGVRLLATPSTCVQFEPRSADFSVDRSAPGYRWLELHADGRIETGVIRAEHIEFEVDYNSRGY